MLLSDSSVVADKWSLGPFSENMIQFLNITLVVCTSQRRLYLSVLLSLLVKEAIDSTLARINALGFRMCERCFSY